METKFQNERLEVNFYDEVFKKSVSDLPIGKVIVSTQAFHFTNKIRTGTHTDTEFQWLQFLLLPSRPCPMQLEKYFSSAINIYHLPIFCVGKEVHLGLLVFF